MYKVYIFTKKELHALTFSTAPRVLSRGDALQETAASGSPSTLAAASDAAPLLDAPGAVRVLQRDALSARGDLVAAAAVQLDGLDLVVRDHHQLGVVQRTVHAHHVQVLDWDVVWKHLDLLDHHWTHVGARVEGRGVQSLDHLAVVGADEDDVVLFVVGGHHLRVYGDFREAVPEENKILLQIEKK
jgi:hypothetical protein